MTVRWSSADLGMLTQYIPEHGVQGAALHVRHTLRETYERAVTMGAHVPPNGTGPWPRRSNKFSTWPTGDEHILRQEYDGPRSVPFIAELLERDPNDVAAMAITLGLAQQRAQSEEPATATVHDIGTSRAAPAVKAKGKGGRPGIIWTKQMDAYLKKHYHQDLAANIAAKLGVTYYQITRRARDLKIAVPTASWTREETVFLLEHLQTEPLTWVAEQLGRTMAAVSLRPKQLGIFPGWTRENDRILLRNRKHGHAFVGAMIDRPAYAVANRERFLTDKTSEFSKTGLQYLFEEFGKKWIDGLIYLPVRPTEINKVRWKPEEIEFLKTNYPLHGSVWCAKQLGCAPKRVRHKALNMGLLVRNKPAPWSAEDDQWLRDNVKTVDREECARHLNRSVASVSVRASVIGAFKRRD